MHTYVCDVTFIHEIGICQNRLENRFPCVLFTMRVLLILLPTSRFLKDFTFKICKTKTKTIWIKKQNILDKAFFLLISVFC